MLSSIDLPVATAHLGCLLGDGMPFFQEAVDELRWRCKLFDRLRRCMRIAEPDGRNGLNDNGGNASMNRAFQGTSGTRGYGVRIAGYGQIVMGMLLLLLLFYVMLPSWSVCHGGRWVAKCTRSVLKGRSSLLRAHFKAGKTSSGSSRSSIWIR